MVGTGNEGKTTGEPDQVPGKKVVENLLQTVLHKISLSGHLLPIKLGKFGF